MNDFETKIQDLIKEEIERSFDTDLDYWFADGMAYWLLPYTTSWKNKADFAPLEIVVFAESIRNGPGRVVYRKSLDAEIMEMYEDDPKKYADRCIAIADALENLVKRIRATVQTSHKEQK